MDDKNMMQNLLLLEKGCCDLYLHGAVESSTKNVLGAFNSALDVTQSTQDEIYTKMTNKGWYNVCDVEQTKVDQLRQKFATAQ